MKKETKSILIGLFQGLLFAGFMAAFDYRDGKDFDLWKFLFYTTFFGIFMALSFNVQKNEE